MAYNYQQVPFWDFIRGFEQNGTGVDHPAEGHPAAGFNPFGPRPPPGADGEHARQSQPFTGGFPFGHGGLWGQGPPQHGGPGSWRGRGGRRGRHDENDEHEHTPNGSRTASANRENTEGGAREGSPHGHGGRHGHGHHGTRGCGYQGRGRGGWGGRGGPGFDLNALFESLSAHPLAEAFRIYANAQRSGETLVPEDTDAENSFTPPVDIFFTERDYVLHVALPGAKKEDIGVNWDAEKGLLNLAGVVYRQGDEEFLKTLSKSERKVGVFERTVKLPPGSEDKEEIDGDAITAKLEDGILVVTVPRVEKEWTEVKKVDIL